MASVIRAWLFLTLLSLTLIVFGNSIGGREGLLIALVTVLAVNSYVYFYENKRLMSLFASKALEGQDPYGVQDISRRLAIKLRLPVPEIYILDSASPQAAVFGRGFSQGVLLLTEGLLRKLSRAEVEAIMAYQLVSIKNLNTLAFSAASFLTSSLLLITGIFDFILRVLIVEKKNPNTTSSHIFTRLSIPFITFVLRLSIRPSFYFTADKMAAQLIADPKDLAQALWKLDAMADTVPLTVPISAAPMFIVNPLTQVRWMRFFNTHPVASERIERLVGYYPL